MKEIIEIYFYDKSKERGKNLLAQSIISPQRKIPNIGDDVEIDGKFCRVDRIVYNQTFTKIDFIVTVKGVRLHR